MQVAPPWPWAEAVTSAASSARNSCRQGTIMTTYARAWQMPQWKFKLCGLEGPSISWQLVKVITLSAFGAKLGSAVLPEGSAKRTVTQRRQLAFGALMSGSTASAQMR